MKPTSFADIDTNKIENKIIFLDIDGTITSDGRDEVEVHLINKIKELVTKNKVYLCSNKKNKNNRNLKIESLSGAIFLDTTYRKPNKKILDLVKNEQNLDSLVIGDKYLTDARFAYNIEADFIYVSRIKSDNDSVFTKITYLIDDIFKYMIGFISKFRNYLLLMRPQQWIKNLAVFIPIFFAKELFFSSKFEEALAAFVAFCFFASLVYVVNDIADREVDARHPLKCVRPIASGAVSLREAVGIAAVLFLVGAWVVYMFAASIILPIFLYLVINLVYSFYIKNVAIFDLICVSLCYLLRVVAGGLATDTFISRWLILMVIFVALFITVGKRRSELAGSNIRTVLKSYNLSLLDHLLSIAASLTLVIYGIYTILGVTSDLTVYSIVFVIIGIFRYLNIVHTSHGAEFPEKLFYKDKTIFLSVLSWLIFMFCIFYF